MGINICEKVSETLSTPITEAHLFGFPVHLVNLLQARTVVEHALMHEQNLHVVTLNPEMIMQGEADPELGQILKSAGLILPDGVGVVWALKRQGRQIKRLPGIEFSESLLKWLPTMKHSVAIIGAEAEALELATNTLRERYPKLSIAYTHHGFFKPDEEEAIVKACAATQPKVVLVALGVPRQEKWIARYQHLFTGATFVGIGGSLDVWSGRARRAPKLMRQLNLEWMYRITSEPWRIKRTYKTLPMFVVKVLLGYS